MPSPTKRLSLYLALALALTALGAAPSFADYLRIYYPDIEQGSSTVVVSPTGKALVIDAGTELHSTDDDVVQFIRDLINRGVITDLEYILVTHYDEDHIGRMEHVLSQGLVAVDVVTYDRGTDGGTPGSFAYSDYSYAAGQHDRTTITANTTIDLGGGVTVETFTVNATLPDTSSVDLTGTDQQENARSVTVVVHYGDFDAWIGGDLTGNTAKGVADVEGPASYFVGDVDLYTFNHHGSDTSSTQDFLDVLKAEVGIAQMSASNGFGHPRADVVSRFLATDDTNNDPPLFFQQNPGDPGDVRSDDTLADGIADPDDVDNAFGLPGSITVLSDGTSYQVFGGDIVPVKLAADEGLGTLGDYPPAILSVDRAPLVPAASAGVAVAAEIHDEGSFTAAIHYTVDGVSQTPVSMSQVGSTDFYEGTIPGQSNGARVAYQVVATDNMSQVADSPVSGYFSGTTPVADLRINDGLGVLVPNHFAARVSGNVTVEPGVFHDFVSQVWVQDGAGDGIQVFDGSLLDLDRGDEATFTGALEQFAGQTQLNVSQPWGNFGHTLVGSGSVPSPQLLTVSQIGEAVEGALVRIDDVTVDTGEIPLAGDDSLTITDDNGTSTVTLRIDGNTDIPGASTPTQSFDVIGVVSQYDGYPPFSSGYQILPRGRADILSDEVNHPAVIVSEVHADPHATLGDANGSGGVSTTQDEFVELLNTSYLPVDISGYTLADSNSVRHTFPSGTIVPAREAVVVFGGGTPVGAFGNAAANELVFTASTGSLGLNNDGDTVTLADDSAVTVQSVTYGSAGGDDQSLVRSPDYSNAPFVKHTVADTVDASRFSPGTTIFGGAFTVPPGAVLLSEVLYDPSNADGGLEWIELWNASDVTVDLSALALGWGGNDYTSGVLQLSGTIAAGETFVIGGPTSSSDNANPTFDLQLEISPGFQNSGAVADGVALFNIPALLISGSSVPIDAVVYGGSNSSDLLDEDGVANNPDVGDASSGASIERTDEEGHWQIQPTPSPNSSPLETGGLPPPEPPASDVILSEVYYDAVGGDNGLEWVELFNKGESSVNLAGYCLGWGGTNYTYGKIQLSGTIAPGETFVVGGTTSSSANANPTFDQSADLNPDLQNSGSEADGVALFNVLATNLTTSTVPVDAVVYGGSNSNDLIDESGSANPPEVVDAPEGSSIERYDLVGSWQVQSTPTPNASPLESSGGSPNDVLILTEVFYDVDGSDNGYEWVEIYNAGEASVNLAGYSLGWGGSDYTYGTQQLSGSVAPGETFVVGGLNFDAANGDPEYDQAVDLSPDLQNSGSVADGVALFDVLATVITSSTVPIDAVVYGTSNSNSLIDETGYANSPEVGDAPAGSSIERTTLGGVWQIQAAPTPNAVPTF